MGTNVSFQLRAMDEKFMIAAESYSVRVRSTAFAAALARLMRPYSFMEPELSITMNTSLGPVAAFANQGLKRGSYSSLQKFTVGHCAKLPCSIQPAYIQLTRDMSASL